MMKLEEFMEMATKLQEQRPIYQSLICSPNVLEGIKKEAEIGRSYYGIQVFVEQYFPDTIVWLLDKEHTQCYLREGLAGLITKMAKAKKPYQPKPKREEGNE